MDSIYVVYQTDARHSYTSRDIIGIATTHPEAVTLIEKHIERSGETLSEEQFFNLNNIMQTQGFEGEGEYQFEKLDTNTLL